MVNTNPPRLNSNEVQWLTEQLIESHTGRIFQYKYLGPSGEQLPSVTQPVWAQLFSKRIFGDA